MTPEEIEAMRRDMAALKAERDNLRRLLREAREWNWIEFDECGDTELPELASLDREIDAALNGETP